MHPACLIELAHGRINNGVARLAFAPGLEELLIIFPVELVINRPKSSLSDVGKLPEDLFVKISPDQLGYKDVHLLFARGILCFNPSRRRQDRARGNCAEAQMWRKARGRVR